MKRIIVFSILLFCAICLNGQSIILEAPRVVSTDENFRITFTVNGEPTNFTPPSINGFDILAGPTTSTMNQTVIINGKRTQSITISYTYILQAKTVGKFTIPSASVVIDGATRRSEPATIEVIKGEPVKDSKLDGKSERENRSSGGGDLFISTSVNKTKIVKGEPVIVTIKLYTREQIVGFEDVKFPSFNGFWSQEIDAPTNINFTRENINGKIYNASLLRRFVLIPQQSGNLTISPAEMLCSIQIPLPSQGARSIFDDFFGGGTEMIKRRVVSKPLTLTVASLPEKAPLSFAGAVGKFEMTAKLNRDTISTNDAASLLITISGTGNINLMEAPKVNFPTGFELFDVKEEMMSTGAVTGKKVFEYPFIARAPGIFNMPPVEFSYFDYDKMQYVTLSSKEVSINVSGVATVTPSSSALSVDKKAVANLSEDIRYINQTPLKINNSSSFIFGSLYYTLFSIVIISAYFVSDRLLSRRIKRRKDIAAIRTRRANKIAGVRLKKAYVLLGQQLYEPFYDELHKAIEGYISDKLVLNFSDLSRENISIQLSDRGVLAQQIERLNSLLDSCEFAKYSPQKDRLAVMRDDYNRAIELLSDLEVSL